MQSARTRWDLVAALYLAGVLAGMQFTKISATLGTLAEIYPGAPVAFAVSGVAVMGVVFGVVAGGLVAAMGARRALVLGLLLSAVVGGLGASLPPFGLFLGLRVLEGAGHLVIVVAGPTLMAAVAAPRDRGLVMGIWATFFGIGFASVALVVGGLGGTAEGPVWVSRLYGGHAGLAVALAVWLWWALPRDARAGPRRRVRLSDHLMIYRAPRRFAPGLGHGLYAMLFLALVTVAPATLGAGWLAHILPLTAVLGSFVVGLVLRVKPPGQVVWGSFLIMAGLFGLGAIIGGSAAIALVIAALVISGLTAGAGFAAVPVLNASDEDRALANGALAQLGNVGTFSGTPILVGLAPQLHLPVAAVLCLVAAGLTAWAYGAAIKSAAVSL